MAKAEKKEAQVTEAAFLKAMNAKQAALKEAAKKERPSGMMDDSEILARLGIEPNETKVFQANVNTIKFSFAKNDPKRPMFRFVYTITSDDKKANGVNIPKMFILEDTVNSKTKEVIRSEQDNIDSFMYELQGLGENTDAYKNPMQDAMTAIKQHTKDKTAVSLSIRHWVGEKSSGMNVKVNTAQDNSDLDESGEEYTDTEPPEATPTNEFNPEDWVGGWIDYKFDGDDVVSEGTYTLLVKSYDEDSNSFICEDENGEMWDVDNGYAVSCIEQEKFEWSTKNDK